MGIGLVKVLLKTMSSPINCKIGAAVRYHDTLHGFRSGRGVRTTSLQAKLLQQIT